jgi:2-phosphosulfolactate phosphatase
MAVDGPHPWTAQTSAEVRFEWGPTGLGAVGGEHVVIVDVLRFTTAVCAGVDQGARIYPYRWKDDSARTFADSVGAVLAGGDPLGPSLSPVRLSQLQPDDRVVLPSPNGSTCAALAHEAGARVYAGCLRNATAVAEYLAGAEGPVTVVAAGERWPDGSLRPALEDLLGAGAVLAALDGSRSPEAEAAATLWSSVGGQAGSLIRGCGSGIEQVERGWADDLAYAVELDASDAVPMLVDSAFVQVG